MIRILSAYSLPPKQVRLVRTGVHAAGVVEHLADLYSAPKQFFARGLDIRDDQVHALRGTRCCRRDILTEDHRAPRARRRELQHAEVISTVVVGVEPPPETSIKLLRAIH